MASDTSTKKNQVGTELKRGWTTGACATAALKSALHALHHGSFLDPVEITLPKGQQPSFCLASEVLGNAWAQCSIIKDAGDDPDVTHGAEIIVKARKLQPGAGICFVAGEGVGMVKQIRAKIRCARDQSSLSPS